MFDLLGSLARQLTAQFGANKARSPHSRTYACRCGATVFFNDVACGACGAWLGFLPEEGLVVALEAGEDGAMRAEGVDGAFAPCGNHGTAAACNWLRAMDDPQPLCRACRLNRTIPDLDDADNARWWGAIERAKRRVVAQLLACGLPVRSKETEDPERGVAFDFLRSRSEGARVLTGHASGLITLNVEEADDAIRAKIQQELHEPYRTLIGHFRHELGHYYWDLLIWDTPWLDKFRAVFGDERADYADALKRNYEQGPPEDWRERHITAYASVHPWEDWAETWAHYLHIVDSLGTAIGFGIDGRELAANATPFGRDDLYDPDDPEGPRFLRLLNAWIETIMVLNELARSLGQADFYPFELPRAAVRKLQFVHMVVRPPELARPPAETAPA